jgi:hypothetical protein
MSMNQLVRLAQGGGGPPAGDTPQVDTAEQIYISSLALIKMLKHGMSRSNDTFLIAKLYMWPNVAHSCLCRPFVMGFSH